MGHSAGKVSSSVSDISCLRTVRFTGGKILATLKLTSLFPQVEISLLCFEKGTKKPCLTNINDESCTFQTVELQSTPKSNGLKELAIDDSEKGAEKLVVMRPNASNSPAVLAGIVRPHSNPALVGIGLFELSFF